MACPSSLTGTPSVGQDSQATFSETTLVSGLPVAGEGLVQRGNVRPPGADHHAVEHRAGHQVIHDDPAVGDELTVSLQRRAAAG